MTLIQEVEFTTEACCACGVHFAMTRDFNRRRRDDHGWFYCPAGHAQRYSNESEAEKACRERDVARQQVARAEQEAAEARRQAHAAADREREAKRETARLKKRSAAGVCPCCNRSFVALARHMASKHPELRPKLVAARA